jgi:glutamyl/glutaminyl-tRNA synthetase
MALLNISVDRITHTSDHFDYMLAAAERLIKEGLAYVDDTPMEQVD